MSTAFPKICSFQKCFPTINAAHAFDGQHQLAFPLVVTPALRSRNRGAGVGSRSDDHLAVDLDWIDNL